MKKMLIVSLSLLAIMLASEFASADMVAKVAKEQHLDVDLFRAILEVESGHTLMSVNYKTYDYGIGQINIKNIEKLKLSKHKLLNNYEYSVRQSAIILKWFQKNYASTEPFWYCRYNVGTGSLKAQRRKVACYKYVRKILNALPDEKPLLAKEDQI